jgi:hypothetical protein
MWRVKPWFVVMSYERTYVLPMQDEDQGRKKKKKPTRKTSNTYTNRVDKKAATPYLIKKKKNGKVIVIKANKQANKGKGVKWIWVPK